MTEEEKKEVREAFIGFIKYANRFIVAQKLRRMQTGLSPDEALLKDKVTRARELLNIKDEDLK